MSSQENKFHTSRNGVTVEPGDKVLIIGSDNKHWKISEGLIGVVEFRNGEARVTYEDARPWYINTNTDIELVDKSEEIVLPLIKGKPYVKAGIVSMPTQQPETPLVDKLEQALATLTAAQEEVERLQAEYREAYPLIKGIVPLQEDMNDPANWKEGDVVECIDSEATGEPDYFTEGEHYLLFKKDGSTSYKYVDDEGDCMWANNEAFCFVSRLKK